jgi:hypothetical protein
MRKYLFYLQVSRTHFRPCSTDDIDNSLSSTFTAAYLFNVFTDSVLLENYQMAQAQDHKDAKEIFQKHGALPHSNSEM